MLVLSRKPGERVRVGTEVVITIVRLGSNTVRLGIEAPEHMKIVREQLLIEVQDATNDSNPDASATRDGGSTG
ncbi:MAG: carbon storage regulator [Planctomycetota bacterium]